MGKNDSPEYNRRLAEKNRRNRARRLAAARKRGTHTKGEWVALLKYFGDACVRCAAEGRECEYAHRDKDHILPLFMGGSDDIVNLQPLCPMCNVTKHGTTDYRSIAAERMGLAWPPQWWPAKIPPSNSGT